ncbi:MAG: porphobilinogen synthase [Pseudomonadota bacterium]
MTDRPTLPSIDDITGHQRLRRTRRYEWSRALVRENQISVSDLIWPIFVIEGHDVTEPVSAMPGVERMSIDRAVEAARMAESLGVPAVAIFPNTPPNLRSEEGEESCNPDNLVCRATRAIREAGIEIGIMLDVALDPYTTHGHDGVLRPGGPVGAQTVVRGDQIVGNDATVEILIKQSLVQAEAGADILGPSDMMDGRIGAIRRALDAEGRQDVMIMSYAAKYASAFYGPFREAVGADAHLKGDKRGYQMDPANGNEALREIAKDIEEGADMVMVKPGMPYLDIIARASDTFNTPMFAYQVSGEYSMIHAAAANGWIDGESAMWESLTAFKRAGCDGILTYFASTVAQRLAG